MPVPKLSITHFVIYSYSYILCRSTYDYQGQNVKAGCVPAHFVGLRVFSFVDLFCFIDLMLRTPSR